MTYLLSNTEVSIQCIYSIFNDLEQLSYKEEEQVKQLTSKPLTQ